MSTDYQCKQHLTSQLRKCGKTQFSTNKVAVLLIFRCVNFSIYPKNIRKVFDQYFKKLKIKDVSTNKKAHFVKCSSVFSFYKIVTFYHDESIVGGKIICYFEINLGVKTFRTLRCLIRKRGWYNKKEQLTASAAQSIFRREPHLIKKSDFFHTHFFENLFNR